MSIADAVRARDLEARVAALEQLVGASLAKPGMSAPTDSNAELNRCVQNLQGQITSLRAKVDRLIPPGPPAHLKTDNAA